MNDTRCYTAIGGMGLVPCMKQSDYVLLQKQRPPSQHWERNYACIQHIGSEAMVFIPGPTEIRIVPIAQFDPSTP